MFGFYKNFAYLFGMLEIIDILGVFHQSSYLFGARKLMLGQTLCIRKSSEYSPGVNHFYQQFNC